VYLAVKTKPLLSLTKSPARLAGLFCLLLLLNSCQTATPEDVTTKFWQSLAQGQLEAAKNHVTVSSQHLVNPQDIDTHSPIKINQAIINEEIATVETSITRNKRPVAFNTILVKEKDEWRVDYQQTQINISMIPFDGVIKSLENLGNTLGKQLEQQIPAIQKEMESIGGELKNKIDEFGHSLEQPEIPNKPKTRPGTI
jgi:hypothetical protein